MARTFDGVNDRLTLSVGTLGTYAFGTWVALLKRNSTGWGAIMSLNSGGSEQSGWEIQDNPSLGGHLAYYNNLGDVSNSPTITILNADNWVLVAITKATGTVKPRFHAYTYD